MDRIYDLQFNKKNNKNKKYDLQSKLTMLDLNYAIQNCKARYNSRLNVYLTFKKSEIQNIPLLSKDKQLGLSFQSLVHTPTPYV